jgi:hypothetical protein
MRRMLLIRNRRESGLATRTQSVGLLLILASLSAAGEPGNRLERDPRLQYDDLAELASREPRAELSCQVSPEKPSLGFDLRFHSDYHITIPVKALADSGGWLKVAARVMPSTETEHAAYLVHRFAIPGVAMGTRGEVVLASGFELGPGRYRVDWIMRDTRERVCLSHWELEAKAGRPDLPLTLAPNQIVDAERNGSDQSSLIKRDPGQPVRLKILLNLSPAKAQESILRPEDGTALLSILRSIIGQPGVALSTFVAFNLRDQKIVYRQEKSSHIDFSGLERASHSRTSGTIDIRLLRDPESETHFLTRLLTDELGARADAPDAIIIIGLKVDLDKKVPLEPLKAKGSATCPVFYLNYNPNPNEPLSDTIASALKAYKGVSSFNITLPRDLGSAMRETLSRISKWSAL